MKNFTFLIKGAFALLCFLISISTFSQTTGDFRSVATGNWETLSTWQTWNGSSWIAATSLPGQNNGTYKVTVQAAHTVVVNTNYVSANMGDVEVLGILNLVAVSNPKTITLNTALLDIRNGGELRFDTQKVDLYLPTNSVLAIQIGGNITGACSNNTEIFIGTQLIAVCTGGGGGVLTFGEVVTGGGTINANIDNPADNSVFYQYTSVDLQGSYSGTASAAVTYSGFITDPSGTTTSYVNVLSIPAYTFTQIGQYLLSFTVTTTVSGSPFSNTETHTVTVIAPTYTTYTTSGTYTVPACTTEIQVLAWGAGGGGSDYDHPNSGGGGGGGGGLRGGILTVTPGSTIAITIGNGGAGGNGRDDDGNPGTNTIVSHTSGTITANGGLGGAGDNGIGGGGGGGSFTGTVGTQISYTGGSGGNGDADEGGGGGGAAGTTANGSNGINLTGGNGGNNNGNGGTGDGGDGGDDGAGNPGSNYGGGGGAAGDDGGGGGDGANGLVLIAPLVSPQEINVTGLTNTITSGDTTPSTADDTDFGNTTLGTPVSHTFTIQNLGSSALTLGAITFGGTHASEFTITTAPVGPVASCDFTTFVVQFNPAALGLRTATISIVNDDTTGGENPYTFALQGTAVTPAPEINITGLTNTITSGDPTPSTADDTDFGNVNTFSSASHTFTIQNTGTAALSVGAITFSGANAAEFSITTPPAASVASGGNTTFIVQFSPTGAGIRTAVISIVNGDTTGGENPYTFTLQGTGVSGPPNYSAYYESFDANDGGWTLITSTNDTWLWTNSFPASATELNEGGFWRNSSYNNYVSNTNIIIQSPQYDFTGLQNLQLSLDVKYKTQNNYDGMRILYSVAGGAYTLLGASGSGTEWYEDNVSALGSDGWNDDSHPTSTTFTHSKFKRATLPLSDATFSNQSNVRFRIEFSSDGSTEDDGVAFDNFLIEADPLSALNNPSNAPANIASNLRLWLRSDSGIAAADGSPLTTWEDHAYDTVLDKEDASAASSLAPIYRNNAANNINFNPVAEFDNTATQYMNGKGGYYSQDYFAVVLSNDVVDTQTGTFSPGRQFPIGGRFADTNFHEDPTGLGFGSVSARYVNEVIAHTINSYSQSGSPGVNSYGMAYTSNTDSFDHVLILNVKTNTAGTASEIYKNGKQIDNTVGTTGTSGTGTNLIFAEFSNMPFLLGAGRSGLAGRTTSQLNGRLTEIISYSSPNSAISQQKIQSYLAIKYGVTLQDASSTLTNHRINDVDYIDSAGNIIWDTSANAVYNYDVTGIGRDDASGLNQKQSKSVNETSDGTGLLTGILTMGLTDIYDTNSNNIASNPTNFNDKEFLVWGNDGTSITAAPFTVNVDMSAGITGLSTPVTFDGMQPIWKVVEIGGNIPSVEVSIPTNAVRNISPPGSYLMFISDTNNFDPTADYRVMTEDAFGNLKTDYDFDGTKFITFGYAPQVIVERSVYFDGVDDFMDVGNYKDLNTTEFTVSAWIKRSPGSGDKSIFSKRDETYTQGYDFKITSGGNLEMSWFNVPLLKQTITSATVIPENEWHHVSVIFDNGDTNLYIDGVLDQNAPVLLSPNPTDESFIIAGAGKTSTTDLFIGNIDEVRIWNVALSLDQLHYIMNQEIEENATLVDGMKIPTTITKNEVASIPWSDLVGYYPMSIYTYTNTNDHSDNQNQGALRNLDTVDFQTAPLPYESETDGPWTTDATWLNNTVQTLPNALSIVDGTTPIDWNIVETNHNISIDTNISLGRERSVLGLTVNSNELTINGDTPTGTGNGLTVTHYLELNGSIDLQGESQLIQTDDSVLVVGSDGGTDGFLERDQQGTADTYTYNYWSSPVGVVNTTSSNATYKSSYSVQDVLRDGTTPATPAPITFLTTVYEGTTSPLGIADYWIWKFADLEGGNYSLWQHIRSTGTMLPGEGFTMKGPGSGSITTPQNYVFEGQPNNGDITFGIGLGNDYLIGNPYPSAIDALEFLSDNPETDGTLYFWEHWGGGSHYLKQYQGGYALYNYSGGVGSASQGVNHPWAGSGGTPLKTPDQFIPVSQGFFVNSPGGGTITFENDQRTFQTESSGNSVFIRTNVDSGNEENNYIEDDRMKFRIGLNSVNLIHRQLLLTVDKNATEDIDWGYDGKLNEEQIDDMYWIIEGEKFIIQGTNTVTAETSAPLGIHVRDGGINSITIDHLENVPDEVEIYAHDKELNIYHDLRESDYEMYLTSGNYLDRFALVFTNPNATTLSNDDLEIDHAFGIYYNNDNDSVVLHNPNLVNIERLELFNIIGQSIYSSNEIETQSNTEIKVSNLSAGTYILNLITESGKISKKVLVK